MVSFSVVHSPYDTKPYLIAKYHPPREQALTKKHKRASPPGTANAFLEGRFATQ